MDVRFVSAQIRHRLAAGAGMWLLLVNAPGLQAGERDAQVQIELLSEATVHSGRVTLGDIAQIRTKDSQALRRLSAMPLGAAPRAEESVTLGREGLVQWVDSRDEQGSSDIQWTGASACRIHRAMQRVEGSHLAECAEAQLRSLFTAEGLKAEVRLLQTPAGVSVPAGKVELRPRVPDVFQARSLTRSVGSPTRTPALYAKRQSAWVDLLVDGAFIRSSEVDFEISVFAPAMVVKETTAAGETVDPAHTEIREVEWSGRMALPLTVPPGGGSAQLLRARRALSAGQVLTAGDVEPKPMVVRGSTAQLREVHGAITVEGPVEALQDGFPGQVIEVKMPGASKSIRATVVGPGQVEVGS